MDVNSGIGSRPSSDQHASLLPMNVIDSNCYNPPEMMAKREDSAQEPVFLFVPEESKNEDFPVYTFNPDGIELEEAEDSEYEPTADQTKPYCCDECGKCFSQKAYMVKHKQIHTGAKPFACEICGKRFTERKSVRHHQLVHTGAREHPCEECGKSFTTVYVLNTHKLTHTGIRRYECDQCGQRFRQNHGLRKHKIIKHKRDKPFACNECERVFPLKSYLEHHIKNQHVGDKNKALGCRVCGESLPSKIALNAHLRTHITSDYVKKLMEVSSGPVSLLSTDKPKDIPPENDEESDCDSPDSLVHTEVSQKTNHHKPLTQVVHQRIQPSLCKTCGKLFSSAAKLAAHLCDETAVRLHKVAMLGRSLGEEWTLQKRQQTPSGSFACNRCEKVFPSRGDLENHKVTHMRSYFTCSVCQKCFPQKSIFISHMRSHLKPQSRNSPLKSCDNQVADDAKANLSQSSD